MTKSRRSIRAIVSSILVVTAAGAAGTALAEPGYVTDGFGNIVRNGENRCVQSGSWRPENAIPECEPQMFVQQDDASRMSAEQQRPAEADTARNDTESTSPMTAPTVPTPVSAWHEFQTEAYFPLNSAELTPEAQRTLSEIAERVGRADEARVRIVGYADSTGPQDSNLALSKRRADAVRSYLIQRGVPDRLIETAALGEQNPAVDCSDQTGPSRSECLQANRRSEITASVLESSDADTGVGSDGAEESSN